MSRRTMAERPGKLSSFHSTRVVWLCNAFVCGWHPVETTWSLIKAQTAPNRAVSDSVQVERLSLPSASEMPGNAMGAVSQTDDPPRGAGDPFHYCYLLVAFFFFLVKWLV